MHPVLTFLVPFWHLVILSHASLLALVSMFVFIFMEEAEAFAQLNIGADPQQLSSLQGMRGRGEVMAELSDGGGVVMNEQVSWVLALQRSCAGRC